jgi:hypothetical protein
MMKLIRAMMLVLLLFVCAYADDGIIQAGKNDPPPPPPKIVAQPSDEPIIEDGTGCGVEDTTSEVALGLLLNLLALF